MHSALCGKVALFCQKYRETKVFMYLRNYVDLTKYCFGELRVNFLFFHTVYSAQCEKVVKNTSTIRRLDFLYVLMLSSQYYYWDSLLFVFRLPKLKFSEFSNLCRYLIDFFVNISESKFYFMGIISITCVLFLFSKMKVQKSMHINCKE